MVRTLRTVTLIMCGLLVAVVSARPIPASADSGDVAFDSGLQWGLDQIGAEMAWEVSRGAGITIAVVDSGVALEHEDLESKLVAGVACRGTGGDPAACTGSPQDDDGHGTHVAGIAAAATGNGEGIAGTAPDARIMPVKVLFRACTTCPSAGNAGDVAAAVRWAADRGADVINLSLGSTNSSVFGPGFAEAIDFAWSKGAIPVVAAGNDFVRTADLGQAPAVVVSATDRDDAAPAYSNGIGRARWAVAAPGGAGDDTAETCSQDGEPRGILSTYWAVDEPESAYACLSGTSMAAPHVSGGLALLLARGFTPQAAVDRLLATAVDLGEPGFDPVFGAGRIDLAAALQGSDDGAAPGAGGDVTPATSSTDTVAVENDVASAPGDDHGTSAPQLFVEADGSDVPPGLVAVAIAAIVATGVAAAILHVQLRQDTS